MKNGFEVIDSAPPDFNLLMKKFDERMPSPQFKGNWQEKLNKYEHSLTIIRADQCPYTVKNVKEIARKKHHGDIPLIGIRIIRFM